jgi:predicted amidophosphoribosyltransferase
MRTYCHRVGRGVGRLGQALLELVWPTRCAGCEKLGVLLCDGCRDALLRIDQEFACPRCGAPAGSIVCTECTPIYERADFAFSHARCALEFSELTRRIVVAYKDGGDRQLAPVLAQLIAQVIPFEWRLWANALTWIPADAHALRRRGFDHMELIAQALAAQMGMCAVSSLIKRSRADQRRLNRAQRAGNMATVFSARLPQPVRPGSTLSAPSARSPAASCDARGIYPKHLILVDDVFTTGATLDAAARTLLAAGVREVRVATIARVW